MRLERVVEAHHLGLNGPDHEAISDLCQKIIDLCLRVVAGRQFLDRPQTHAQTY